MRIWVLDQHGFSVYAYSKQLPPCLKDYLEGYLSFPLCMVCYFCFVAVEEERREAFGRSWHLDHRAAC